MKPTEHLHDLEKLYLALGRAIVGWSHVEDALCRVYLASIEMGDVKRGRLAASAGFYAAISFETKLAIVNAALAIKLHFLPTWEHDRLQEKWRRLHKHIQRLQRTRNRIAHFQTITTFSGETGDSTSTLRPRIFDPRNLLLAEERTLTAFRSYDLERIGQAFGLLMVKIEDFAKELRTTLTS
jgi:hypothetical protein